MEGWYFDLTVISGSNLKNVRERGKMKVYAEVSINGKPELTRKTPVDHKRKTNPRWNTKTPFTLSDESVKGGKDMLVVKLYCKRSFADDMYVGELELPLKQLFKDRDSARIKSRDWDVIRVNEGGRFGKLKLSYGFSTVFIKTSGGSSSSSRRSNGSRTRKVVKSVAKAAGSVASVALAVAGILVPVFTSN